MARLMRDSAFSRRRVAGSCSAAARAGEREVQRFAELHGVTTAAHRHVPLVRCMLVWPARQQRGGRRPVRRAPAAATDYARKARCHQAPRQRPPGAIRLTNPTQPPPVPHPNTCVRSPSRLFFISLAMVQEWAARSNASSGSSRGTTSRPAPSSSPKAVRQASATDGAAESNHCTAGGREGERGAEPEKGEVWLGCSARFRGVPSGLSLQPRGQKLVCASGTDLWRARQEHRP